MAFVGAETLAIVREPSVDDGILCDGEEQITFTVELDLGERTLVSREEDRPLLKVEEGRDAEMEMRNERWHRVRDAVIEWSGCWNVLS